MQFTHTRETLVMKASVPHSILRILRETQVQSLGREEPPGGGHGNPLQYSCLENPMDRGVWPATVHGVTESNTTEPTKDA